MNLDNALIEDFEDAGPIIVGEVIITEHTSIPKEMMDAINKGKKKYEFYKRSDKRNTQTRFGDVW